jgi:hypothetical protein
MHLTGCKRAMLLLENKNTQAHREISYEYDAEFVQPYIERLENIVRYSDLYDENKGIPKRQCAHDCVQRATNCAYRHVCWIKKSEREQYRLPAEQSKTQQNASMIHQDKEK